MLQGIVKSHLNNISVNVDVLEAISSFTCGVKQEMTKCGVLSIDRAKHAQNLA